MQPDTDMIQTLCIRRNAAVSFRWPEKRFRAPHLFLPWPIRIGRGHRMARAFTRYISERAGGGAGDGHGDRRRYRREIRVQFDLTASRAGDIATSFRSPGLLQLSVTFTCGIPVSAVAPDGTCGLSVLVVDGVGNHRHYASDLLKAAGLTWR
ncbi:hypothetical protein [Longimicrobium sp.]|uniref:hypothetical protein n=1 Tax=Longimicrobium sp. TaxID=2029185 RepID=UPI003B3AF5EC